MLLISLQSVHLKNSKPALEVNTRTGWVKICTTKQKPILFKFLRRRNLVAAVLLILWLSSALVRVKNERYAMFTRICGNGRGMTEITCLMTVQT